MTAIIITLIICATVILVVKSEPTVTIKHVATTEISESMIEYQEKMNAARAVDADEKDDEQVTIDTVAQAISNIFEGDD